MYVHIAIFRWKAGVDGSEVDAALREIESVAESVDGIVEISTGENSSKYSEGYTHVVLVRGNSQEAIDAYRKHPVHVAAAEKIDAMEEAGVGVDFVTRM